MYRINLDDAQTQLRDLIDAAIRGETVLIMREDAQVVQLVPVTLSKHARHFGSARGMIHMAADFDAPLTDFAEYMG